MQSFSRHVDIARRCERAGDAALQRHLGEGMIDDQAGRAWRGGARRRRSSARPGTSVQSRRTSSRGSSSAAAASRCSGAAAEDEPVEHQPAARADRQRDLAAGARSAAGRIPRGDHDLEPGAPGAVRRRP